MPSMLTTVFQEETRNYLELAEIILLTLAPDSTVVHINEYGARLLGYETADVIGRNWIENFVPESHHGEIWREFQEVQAAGGQEARYHQNPVLTRTSGEVMVYWHYRCVRDANGDISRVISTGIDVSLRSRAEKDLEKSEARAAAVLNSVIDAIITIDARGIVQMINPAASKMFGYRQEEVLGRNVSILMGPPHRQRHDDYIHNYMETGDAKIIGIGRELNALKKNGEEFPIHLTVTEIAGDGKQRSFTGIIRDMTERREIERRIKQRDGEIREAREQLAHMERLGTLNAMTTGIAHELNQPLAAITSYAQACYRMVDTGMHDIDEIKQALKKIGDQVGRAGQVIRRLRTLVNKRDSVRELVDLNELINETIEITRIDSRVREIRFLVELQPSLPAVNIDPIQIQQVVLNLILNSVDALEARDPAERRIRIATSLEAGREIRVCVHDNGVGLLEEHKDKLFNPFFSTKSKGMGMGLHISHSIVASHGGRMAYNSNEAAAGTEFYFTLPVSDDGG